MNKRLLLTLWAASALAQADNTLVDTLTERWQHAQQWSDEYLNRWGDEDRRKAIANARAVHKGAQPELIIRRSGVNEYGDPQFANGLSFNGHTVKPGDSLKKARAVFGQQPGISVTADWPHNRPFNPADNAEDAPITAIHIRLNAPPNQPEPTFNGYLELDSAGIDANTRVQDIRTLASRDGLRGAEHYIYCSHEHAYCYVGQVANAITFDVDPVQKADGPIEVVSVYFVQ